MSEAPFNRNLPEVGELIVDNTISGNLAEIQDALAGIKDENIEPGSVFTRHIVTDSPHVAGLAWKDVIEFQDNFEIIQSGGAYVPIGSNIILLPAVGGVPSGVTIDCRDVSFVFVIASIPHMLEGTFTDTRGVYQIRVDGTPVPAPGAVLAQTIIQGATETNAALAFRGRDSWIVQLCAGFEPVDNEHHIHLDIEASSYNCRVGLLAPPADVDAYYNMTVVTVRT